MCRGLGFFRFRVGLRKTGVDSLLRVRADTGFRESIG